MIRSILTPIARRLGSIAGGMLVGIGATQDESTVIVNGLIALVLVAGDVVLSKWDFLR
jgi:hypothetical protein